MDTLSTKKQVLQRLIIARQSGISVSGASLAAELGVSRNSIWKAINTLKTEGYEIVSEQSKGYYLATHTDVLSHDEISRLISEAATAESPTGPTVRNNIELTVLDSVDSTNNYAKNLPYDGPSQAITSDEQLGGRGRYGRSFSSPKGTGIYLTYSFKPNFPLSEVTRVTTITAVIVHRVLSDVCGSELGIKWINDIYRDGLKICGILTEGVGSIEANFERIIVGIGINVFPSNFPEELKGIAGSLVMDTNVDFSRNEIIAKLIVSLSETFDKATTLNIPEHLDYYRNNCFILGRDVMIHRKGNEPVPAKALGINDNYELIADCNGHQEILSSGEVSVRV